MSNIEDMESDLRIAHTLIERLERRVNGLATALMLIGVAAIVQAVVSLVRSFQ